MGVLLPPRKAGSPSLGLFVGEVCLRSCIAGGVWAFCDEGLLWPRLGNSVGGRQRCLGGTMPWGDDDALGFTIGPTPPSTSTSYSREYLVTPLFQRFEGYS